MFLKDARGFSLLELTISIGLMGLVIAGAMAITSSTSKFGSSMHVNDNIYEISNFAHMATSKVGSCGLKIDTGMGPNEFSNNILPNAPTVSIDIPADLYLVAKSGDPITNNVSLKERFANNLHVRIQDIELVLPEAVDPFPDGEKVTRGLIVVHLQKRSSSGDFRTIPPLKIETVLNILVIGDIVTLRDCGKTWHLFPFDPPKTDQLTGDLTNGPIDPKPLGKHSLCVVSDRALKTGETKTGVFPNRNFKPIAQRANYNCAVKGPNESNEWSLEVDAPKNSGRGGKYTCGAFCI